MIAKGRYWASLLISNRLKWWLVRHLPAVVTWASKVLQGIDPIWDRDPAFDVVFRRVADRALMDRRRAYVLFNVARAIVGHPGDIGEMGVYRGASALLLLEATEYAKDYYGFDSFAGLPHTDRGRDPFWTAGDMNETSVEDVSRFLGHARAHLIDGTFPESLAKAPSGLRFCLAHIDGDLYRTTMAALKYFHEHTLPGGIILVNDYGFFSSPGVRAAVDKFFATQLEHPIYLPSGQCLIIKR